MSRTIGTWHYLFVAVLALATGTDSLPERVARAYEQGLQRLLAETEWPEEMVSDVVELKAELRRIAPIETPGIAMETIKVAIVHADPEVVRGIARRTVLLYRKLVEQGCA